MNQLGHSEGMQLMAITFVQWDKWWSFGHGMWQYSKRWSKLKGLSKVTRTGIWAVLMIHLAGLSNSSEISSRNRLFLSESIVCSSQQNIYVLPNIPCSSHNTPRHRVGCGPKRRNLLWLYLIFP